jgi:hypothetical protein
MSLHKAYNIQLQVSRMFAEGQGLFAQIKVKDWLKERGEEPNDYDIVLQRQPAPAGTREVAVVTIVLRRKDGTPVAPWLLEQLTAEG